MTATESVSTNNIVIGAKKVSGLLFKGLVIKVITLTTRIMYTEALSALIMGFFDIY